MANSVKYLVFSYISISVFACSHAFAEDTEVTDMAPMVVSDQSLSYVENNLAGSVTEIQRDDIAIQDVDNTMALFSQVPGVYFSRYNQGINNQDIGIRGFAAEGSTPHAALLIDGIPSNTQNGYSEMDQLFPANIDTIEVFKGNSDPRFGLFNVAGNYSISTRDELGKELKLTTGSYDSRQLQAYMGEQTGELTHNYFLAYQAANGYRDRTENEKYSLSGRWFYALSDDTTLGFIARATTEEADAPGYLEKNVARRYPKRSAEYARNDGGDKHTQSYSLHFDTRLSDTIDWSLKSYFNHYQRERWVRFKAVYALQDRFDEQDHYGLISTLNWTVSDEWAVQWGVDTQKQQVLEQRFATLGDTQKRDRNTVLRDYDFDFISYGSYLQLENSSNDWLAWNIALRADKLSGEGQFSNGTNTVPTSRDMYDFGTIIQPKLNIFLYPSDSLTLFANLGRSFQQPIGANAYTAGDRAAREVSLNDGWAVGSQWSPLSTMNIELSYWQQRASDEALLVDGVQRYVGETLREGVDLSLDLMLIEKLLLWANVSKVTTEILATGSTQGNALRNIPDYTASVGLNYAFTSKLSWRVHVDSQGSSYVNEQNTGGKYGRFNLVNTGLHYDAEWGAVNFQINNLLNDYYEYVYDLGSNGVPDTIHSPGEGANMSLSITYSYD